MIAMQNDRDRLIELVFKSEYSDFPCHLNNVRIEDLADYLLANGVFILPEDLRGTEDFSISAFIEAMQMYKEKDRYIKPPCKVGDKVYLPCLNDWGDIENYTITEFVLDNDGLLFVVDDEDRETHPIEEIGTDVFLTKDEAEQALKERNNR